MKSPRLPESKGLRGPQFVRFFRPVVEALKELGGSGRPAEVENLVFLMLKISEQERDEQIKSGISRVKNQIHWARFYLAKSGYVDASERGVWSLTEKGRQANLSDEDALVIFKTVEQHLRAETGVPENSENVSTRVRAVPATELLAPELAHREALLALLQSLPPNGFERLCQRVLRESGFDNVILTGKTGDGGLDGYGTLSLNPFMGFLVHFQCKRYTGSVGPGEVREFRGALAGRTDKGIFLTTGSFTEAARKEASREGVAQIELVDGEKLLTIFERLKLGLAPKVVYEIDDSFSAEFRERA